MKINCNKRGYSKGEISMANKNSRVGTSTRRSFPLTTTAFPSNSLICPAA
jgi:hypothetical protein